MRKAVLLLLISFNLFGYNIFTTLTPLEGECSFSGNSVNKEFNKKLNVSYEYGVLKLNDSIEINIYEIPYNTEESGFKGGIGFYETLLKDISYKENGSLRYYEEKIQAVLSPIGLRSTKEILITETENGIILEGTIKPYMSNLLSSNFKCEYN